METEACQVRRWPCPNAGRSLALIEDCAIPWVVIGRGIRRSSTTVMREVEANGGRSRYRPALAERAAERARRRVRPSRLEAPGALRDRVTTELKLGRSPEAIWADLVAEGAADGVGVETIYRAVYAGVLEVMTGTPSRSPSRRSIGTTTGNIGASRLPTGQRISIQMMARAATRSGP